MTVKCEALDGNYYPDMYGSPIDNPNIITSKVSSVSKSAWHENSIIGLDGYELTCL